MRIRDIARILDDVLLVVLDTRQPVRGPVVYLAGAAAVPRNTALGAQVVGRVSTALWQVVCWGRVEETCDKQWTNESRIGAGSGQDRGRVEAGLS